MKEGARAPSRVAAVSGGRYFNVSSAAEVARVVNLAIQTAHAQPTDFNQGLPLIKTRAPSAAQARIFAGYFFHPFPGSFPLGNDHSGHIDVLAAGRGCRYQHLGGAFCLCGDGSNWLCCGVERAEQYSLFRFLALVCPLSYW